MGKPRPFMPGSATYCCYCKRGPLIQGDLKSSNHVSLTATRDHLVPRHALEGKAGRWVPCCFACNQLKGALAPTAWFAFIDTNPGYWRDFPSHQIVLRWLLRYNQARRAQGHRGITLYTEAPANIMALANGP